MDTQTGNPRTGRFSARQQPHPRGTSRKKSQMGHLTQKSLVREVSERAFSWLEVELGDEFDGDSVGV